MFFTKIVFGVDPTLSNKINIGFSMDKDEYNKEVHIKFDSGYNFIATDYDENFKFKKEFKIPENATKVIIETKNKMIAFGIEKSNPAIVSIEHFESNTLYDLNYAFCSFKNLKEFKNFNVTSNVTTAKDMCAEWENFDNTIPEGIDAIFEHLVYADGMFKGWNKFNKQLTKGFFVNTKNLKMVDCVFDSWFVFNQPLPDGFFFHTENIEYAGYAFCGWNAFNQPLPEGFFADTKNLKSTIFMFEDWWKFNYPLPKSFFLNIENIEEGINMFSKWESYAHKLDEHFLRNIEIMSNNADVFLYGWINNNDVGSDNWYHGKRIKDYKADDIVERNKVLKKKYLKKIEDILLLEKVKGNFEKDDNWYYVFTFKDKNKTDYYLIYFVDDKYFAFLDDAITYGNTRKIIEYNKNLFGIDAENVDFGYYYDWNGNDLKNMFVLK